jgi:hypothetical protein
MGAVVAAVVAVFAFAAFAALAVLFVVRYFSNRSMRTFPVVAASFRDATTL